MTFEDWLVNFNSLYYCRIFPSTWSQYCIAGNWQGMTSGGAPPRNANQAWIPEKLNNDGKGNSSPMKSMMPKPSIQLSGTFSKDSPPSNSQKEFSTKKKSILASSSKDFLGHRDTFNFKVNLLPAVDEGGEHEGEMHIKKSIMNTDLLKVRTSMQKKSFFGSSEKRSSLMNAGTNVFNFNANSNINLSLNKTRASELKTGGISNPSKLNILNEPSDDLKNKNFIKRVVITDSEDRWFLNPQYKLEIRPGTKLIISLLQEDEKLSKSAYQKCNFMIILAKGKSSRVWDLKEDNLIKKAVESDDRNISREILVHLDYNEIVKRISQKRKKKLVSKGEKIQINVIPYLEYHSKYEVEKQGNLRVFKLINEETLFWLRIFSSEDIYVTELARPFERSLEYEWTNSTAGGGRYIRDVNKNFKLVENPNWSINPQYLLKFEQNISMKIILRKISGHFSNEEAKVGLIITKPCLNENNFNSLKNINKSKNFNTFNKNDQIMRVMESTNKILESKKIDYDKITRKLSFNTSEYVIESSYSNPYCASLFMQYNKIDSPILLIPTLEYPEATFGYKLSIYSNKSVELFSLNNDNSKVLISEWKESNSGGCHLVQDEKYKKNEEDAYSKKVINWYDNPKFHITFDYKDRLPEVEFEIIVSRSDTIWSKKVAQSIVNSMMGVYIFKYDKEKWRDLCINMDKIDFLPKSEINYKFYDTKVDPKGYIIMPATYGPNVHGPFAFMIKCTSKFNVTPFNPKKVIE